MKRLLLLLSALACASEAFAATSVPVNFTLNTTDKTGAALVQSRTYSVYRPDGLPLTTPLPALLVFDTGSGASNFYSKANQNSFVVVTCSAAGNSAAGAGYNNDDPRWTGPEDLDYTSTVINRLKASDNCNDFFVCGLSKGGHMAYAFACERPSEIKGAASVEEFMQLLANIPQVAVPILAMQGTADTNVAYALARDTMDAWRAKDELKGVAPVTTFESSPLIPGSATQATWRGGKNGTQVAWVTVIGGTHTFPATGSLSSYSSADGLWAFFSQFLTPAGATPKVVSSPVNNTQYAGQPASFWAAATCTNLLTYQWQKNGADIPGATANWYTTPPTAAADNAATFRCVVRSGASSATSASATLTVSTPPAGPALSVQPSDLQVASGQPFTFPSAATGSGTLTYKWQRDGMDIPGATAASYTYPIATPTDSGATFRVLVTDSTGTTTSRRATLTVLATAGAPIILKDVRRIVVPFNQTGALSCQAWSATPLTYQWQRATAANANFADIPGATSATYTPPAPSGAITWPHHCFVSNAAGSTAAASEFFVATASAAKPNFFAGPTSAVAQVGVPFSYQIIARDPSIPVTYDANPRPAGLLVDASTGLISGTPTTAGTTVVTLSSSNAAGSITAPLTITVSATPPPVAAGAWRSAVFGAAANDATLSGDLADPDADGLPNLLEYAIGANPLSRTLSPFALGIDAGYFAQSAIKSPNATGLTWSAEASQDLLGWNPANVTIVQDTATVFQARSNLPFAPGSHDYLRLRVTLP